MASQGPNNPGTRASIELGAVNWTNPDNAQTSNNLYATSTLEPGQFTDGLRCTNFGFTIPAGATIDGIKVEVERKQVQNDASWNIVDFSVLIVKGGSTTGSDKSLGDVWVTSDAYKTFGGTTDKWGTTWTATDINASNFGVQLRAGTDADFGFDTNTASVDHVRITVYYTAAATSNMMMGTNT